MTQNYDNLSAANWHNKGAQDARAEIMGTPTGGLTKEHSSLLAMQSGKAHASEVMQVAEEKMSSDEAINQARLSIERFVQEMMVQESSLSVLELETIQKAANSYFYEPAASQNLAAQGNGTEGVLLAGGVGLALAGKALDGLTKSYDKVCDTLHIPHRVRKIGFVLITTAFLAACASVPNIISTVGAPIVENDRVTPVSAAGNPTETSTATATKKAPTSTPTAAVTKVPSATPSKESNTNLPGFLKPYTEGGYDKKGIVNGSGYGVLDETKIKLGPEKGITVKDTVILSTSEVYYTDENGVTQKGLIINAICRKVTSSYYCFFTGSDSIVVTNDPLSLAAVKSISEQMSALSPEKQPIVKLDYQSNIPGLDEVFADVFGDATGDFKPVNIPGLGKVLPVRHYSVVQK